jgi:hypothetical protein
MARRGFALVLLALALAGAPAEAQHGAPAPMTPDSLASTGDMIVGGLLGGAVGVFLGGAAGGGLSSMLSNNCVDYCGLAGAALGAAIGGTLGLAFGVHVANDRRGSFASAVTGPVIVGVAAIATIAIFEDARVPAIAVGVAIPTAQLATAILGERAAMRRRQAAR